MNNTRYSTALQSLHWLVGILVIAAYSIAVWREELPKSDFRSWLLNVHMSLGMVVFALTLVRLAVRVSSPALVPINMNKYLSLGAKIGHLVLYAILIVLPLIGLLAAWIKGRSVTFFDLFSLVSPFTKDVDLGKSLEGMHQAGGHIFLIIVGAHAAIALFHHYILKDATLIRMLPKCFAKSDSN